MQRTTPAISFTVSHRALMMKQNRPLLGAQAEYKVRMKACWDELPWTMQNMSIQQKWTYIWRCRFEFGVRNHGHFSKIRFVGVQVSWIMGLLAIAYIFRPLGYFLIFQEFPWDCKRENSREVARQYGGDVIAGDGKFFRPFFHIHPPQFTMTTDDL
jgi:hypothetical protein